VSQLHRKTDLIFHGPPLRRRRGWREENKKYSRH
jgi:hypothetical protein